MKKLSCTYLQRSIFLAPDEVRHCCKRFFLDGELKGDVRIFPVESQADLTIDKVIEAKQQMVDAINRGEKTDCYGCPFLEEADWAPIAEEKLNHISIEHHSHCNMRCTYCSETYYGGLSANYDLLGFLKQAKDQDKISEHLHVAWGGGEPTMLKDFDEVYDFIEAELKPKSQKIFTNSVFYSDRIAAGLARGTVSITTSVDAGSVEVFRKVRKVNQYHKVLTHLKKYYDAAPNSVVIKYIFTEDNCALTELESFVADIEKNGLSKASFLVSANYKTEELDRRRGMAIIYLHWLLSQAGASSVAYDDHSRPRVSKIAEQILESDDEELPPELREAVRNLRSFTAIRDSSIIVWGAGEYAGFLLDDSFAFKNANVEFFVDRSPAKQQSGYRNRPVFPPKKILESTAPILVASSFFHYEISQELKQMGISEDRIMSNFFI